MINQLASKSTKTEVGKQKTDIKLWQEDCLDVMSRIDDHSVDLICCDLPFSLTNCKWDKEIDLHALWKSYKRIAKPNASIVLFAVQPFSAKLIMSNPKMYRHTWYWQKERGTNHLRTGREPFRVIEEVCVFSGTGKYRHTMPLYHSEVTGKGKISKTQSETVRDRKIYTHHTPKNVLQFSRDGNLVRTQKPLKLLEYIVQSYSTEGDTVLDNTMGSGTCGIACRKLNRNFIGIEKDEKHYEIAVERFLRTE